MEKLKSKKSIDTIGNCANCGVEYHIHKEINKSINNAQLLEQQQQLREVLFLRPYDLIEIEKRAVTLCDSIIDYLDNISIKNEI